ncbi:MAG: GNAT family N-acetyltransferase [Clostridiales bacterium]|nr:GNAT family N-acetyltransferase [Clostridiales bacterium]
MVTELREWKFTDWETPFAAMINDKIIGIGYIRKSDYYPLPEIYPWISIIFVTENYRGHRINEKLIDFANEHAKKKDLTKHTFRQYTLDCTKNMDIAILEIL